jgi:type II secretory pathway pseudopilin PulG
MKLKKKRGFSLVEIIVGIGIFTLIGLGFWYGFSYISEIAKLSRLKTMATALLTQQIEIVRNLRYDDVGIQNGIPPGVLPAQKEVVKNNVKFIISFEVENIDDPFDGEFPNDETSADYKKVEIEVRVPNSRFFKPIKFTTTVAPKGLEMSTNTGALFIQVINASGQPVPQASIHIVNNQVNPPIDTYKTTDDSGWRKIVGVPPSYESYQITVTKEGYSTDQTYPRTNENPNPIKPHATVVAGQITQITFAIDKLSTLNVYTVNQNCAPIGNISFNLKGAKLIGTNPDIYKYNQNHTTNSSGQKTISNLEWDNYNLTLLSTNYMLAGSMPATPFDLNPDTTLDLFLTLRQSMPKAILIKVKDGSTSLPLSGALVRLQKPGWDQSLITGRGYLRQTDWSGGPGQEYFEDETKYFSQDGNLNTTNPAGIIQLIKVGNNYRESGWLISSTFDTGSSSNFYNIIWDPIDQPSGTEVKFQIATSPTPNPSEWVFKGPDGTSNTYYTLENTNIHPSHNGDRYLRYKVFLTTTNPSKTPIVADIAITYSSSCVPAGQAFFYNLPAANIWTLTVSKEGYQTYTESNIDISRDWQEKEVILNPE